MATSTQEPQGAALHYPRLGEDGEHCASCAAPLEPDQRYCLECGSRRGDARLPFEEYLGRVEPQPAASTPPPTQSVADATRQNDPSPLGAVIGVALLGAMLLIGVLLGRGNDDGQTATPVVQVGDAPTAAASGESAGGETVSDTKVTSEWPEGKNGWTIELGTLPKDGTTSADVDATKADLESKGAADVGVLDSDLYASLPAGSYVVYSGVFDSKGDADAALKDLGSDLPEAKVIEVSDQAPGGGGSSGGGGGALLSGGNGGGAPGDTVEASSADLEALENTTGDDYQEQLNNIPDTVATPGEAPPDDPSVKPGGDSAGDEIVID